MAPLVVALAGCGSASHTPSQPAGASTGGAGPSSKPVLSSAPVPGLGTVLVNSQGLTLYTFAPDAAKKVTCTGSCAQVWRPLKVPTGESPSASGVKTSLVSTDPDPSGGSVVTYNGWPLYTYVVDKVGGTDKGQALVLYGGAWYAIRPDGTVIRTKGRHKGRY